ncbi:dihydroorotate dehydrogenase B catalytic subunit [Methanosarcina sp. A14]|uniref:Dihydroorotate dehydrogenase n=1 Tax=Methanosarcina barkeri MS TaxID=1434108 RepID=A0A0E3QSA8_METBA|nr:MULTISPECIES: dihydroorotate dehydrogenase [Methanosarcina]AKB53425.1 Dihydroorotate dehydrogenase, catalytic subunit [Methanosarcina barkeri MS]OED08806.1 dihydroorotate dehydrogenase B catalytic subunit [Methanosarcina sp. A14]
MYTLTGLKLKNPTILAAGILGTTGASLCRVAHEGGAGAVVTKSIGPIPKTGHPNPSMVKLDCGFLNAMGLPNPSYPSFFQELEIAKKDSGVPVIASIFGGSPAEFKEVAKGLLPAKPDAFELNVSCPHAEGYGAAVGSNPCLVEAITAAVKDIVSVPVWVKLTPNVSDITCIGNAAEAGGADAVVAINTLKGMAIDIESGYPVLGNRSGGLSGKAVKPVAVKCVYDLYTALEIPVIGVGGVSSWQDAIEMMMAGAAVVQVGSAVYDRLDVFSEISTGIEAFLQRKGYSDVKELIGLAHEMV